MTSRKPKKKLKKKAKASKKVKSNPKSSNARKNSVTAKKGNAARGQKKAVGKSARKSTSAKVIPYEFYEHQVYASSDAYSLVESADPSELVRQVQLKCNDGWSTIGGICHSGHRFYQALVKHR